MFTKQDKNENRKVRHARVRVKVSGTSECPDSKWALPVESRDVLYPDKTEFLCVVEKHL